jgi:hypothetical protein
VGIKDKAVPVQRPEAYVIEFDAQPKQEYQLTRRVEYLSPFSHRLPPLQEPDQKKP